MLTEKANVTSRPSPGRPSGVHQLPIAASGALGLLLGVFGVRSLLAGHMLWLFGAALILIGAVAVVLAVRAWQGRRASWALLVALWGVVGFCAFFAAPKVVSLDKLKQVTPEMELKLGREKAEAQIDSENLGIRLTNLAVCTLFAAPFVAACAGLAVRGRDFDRRA